MRYLRFFIVPCTISTSTDHDSVINISVSKLLKLEYSKAREKVFDVKRGR